MEDQELESARWWHTWMCMCALCQNAFTCVGIDTHMRVSMHFFWVISEVMNHTYVLFIHINVQHAGNGKWPFSPHVSSLLSATTFLALISPSPWDHMHHHLISSKCCCNAPQRGPCDYIVLWSTCRSGPVIYSRSWVLYCMSVCYSRGQHACFLEAHRFWSDELCNLHTISKATHFVSS